MARDLMDDTYYISRGGKIPAADEIIGLAVCIQKEASLKIALEILTPWLPQ